MNIEDNVIVNYPSFYTDYTELGGKERYRVKTGYYNRPPQEPALIGVMWDEDTANKWLKITIR